MSRTLVTFLLKFVKLSWNFFPLLSFRPPTVSLSDLKFNCGRQKQHSRKKAGVAKASIFYSFYFISFEVLRLELGASMNFVVPGFSSGHCWCLACGTAWQFICFYYSTSEKRSELESITQSGCFDLPTLNISEYLLPPYSFSDGVNLK